MARHAGGVQHIEAARQLLRTAKTAEELRLAQAVLLPLELGLSMQQTATAIGRSVGATCTMRTRFAAVREGRRTAPRSKRELRNRAGASLPQEARVLDEVFADHPVSGVMHFGDSLQGLDGRKLVDQPSHCDNGLGRAGLLPSARLTRVVPAGRASRTARWYFKRRV